MSEKPWDKLRKPTETPPMAPGYFRCDQTCGVRVEIESLAHDDFGDYALVRLGHEDAGTIRLEARTARVLAGFFGELADQLEGK